MYIPGRLRTASRPSSTVIDSALYSLFFATTGLVSPRTLSNGRQGVLRHALHVAGVGGRRFVSASHQDHSTGGLPQNRVQDTPHSVTDARTATPEGPPCGRQLTELPFVGARLALGRHHR